VIAEAIDTAIAIGWAIVAWIAVGAAVVTIVLFTTILVGAWGWKATRRGLRARVSAEQPAGDPSPPGTAERHTAPRWARTDHHDHHDHEDAA
jgi:hypothetical protein